jgi:hypothetical protein
MIACQMINYIIFQTVRCYIVALIVEGIDGKEECG